MIDGTPTTTAAGERLAALITPTTTFDGLMSASDEIRVDDLSLSEFEALERLAARLQPRS